MASELRVDKIIPTTGVPTGGGGGIIQVVQDTSSTESTTTSTSYQLTGLSVNITPKFNTSKLLVLFNIPLQTNANIRVGVGLYRGSNEVYLANKEAVFGGSNVSNATETVSGMFLDSPGTTSAVTYTVRVRRTSTSSGNFWWSVSQCTCTLTAMEVSA